MAELNRISEHGERKLKLRRESMVISPPPVADSTTEESAEPPTNRGVEEAQSADSVQEKPDGIADDVSNGVNGAVDGKD